VALLPLRLFLGASFAWAGLAKLADPHFFSRNYPSSIQDQLAQNDPNSPIGAILRLAEHQPVLVGLVIALGELAVGLGTLLGFYARGAALGGAALSAVFLMATSWHTRPIYQSVDLAFLLAWTPFVIGGAFDVAALDQRWHLDPVAEPCLNRPVHRNRLRALGALSVIGAAVALAVTIVGRVVAGHA
jgi:thiosulfate dehydrogenase [quinone] large subunit